MTGKHQTGSKDRQARQTTRTRKYQRQQGQASQTDNKDKKVPEAARTGKPGRQQGQASTRQAARTGKPDRQQGQESTIGKFVAVVKRYHLN
jgi:hypothetical protein